ncbi:conserved phage C-terminal domain-containing protein [Clostridium magnum]|uniref:Phage conserved hypothetical protein C-terminal domain-containing protein n=1 Tax=Clostridium magnum DSM 2767 TaxID=1121326 RepID=A0A162QYL0_9CLOT|nr:conserved phage C-terminal domain-containing protein [Clostridium magnum]KZL89157.1 hypothetical protein CLMAG_53750 [Clostridium magnum DSM 2767]SHJ25394.1 phage conserved hypothetical protein, C-terminal domain-containing protein [Clostridium magnum DSM 2767]
MKFTILGYNQAKLVELGLDVIDAALLRYFVDFKDSGTMVKETIEGELYYWLHYEGILKELPILALKKDSVYRRLKNMSKNNVLNHRTVINKGTYSYYNIGSNYIKLLSDSNPKPSDLNPYPYGLESVPPTDLNPQQKINLLKDKSIKDNNIYSQVIDYLNKAADTKYKATTNKTKKLIKVRIEDGFSVEDFYKVIDNKVSEWMNTTMEKYLRPETLFGPKFEGYLNQKNRGDVKDGAVEDGTRELQSDGLGFTV